jgi:hypothetical protein
LELRPAARRRGYTDVAIAALRELQEINEGRGMITVSWFDEDERKLMRVEKINVLRADEKFVIIDYWDTEGNLQRQYVSRDSMTSFEVTDSETMRDGQLRCEPHSLEDSPSRWIEPGYLS